MITRFSENRKRFKQQISKLNKKQFRTLLLLGSKMTVWGISKEEKIKVFNQVNIILKTELTEFEWLALLSVIKEEQKAM